ncbi:DUF3726 domain-containing protein [Defluviimonas sp. WL0002]|uniref:DUF3726 domain-containing protein n=1 Tax=Albidovulum marisflavi TaxID=2984159 RepID=A0ABT2ZCS8_9RHOB|nr:DUF3726 domain-containing protein [Defluviimonas sp. WL0002]MCV2868914.1 DUF3726 domain-containing protein [Defluviimonas sp. WL0002]
MTTEPNDPTASGSSFADAPTFLVLSRNEIESLSTKAARGAGMSWGQAEEAGFAAGWLHEHGVDGSAALLAQLESAAGKPWHDVCPIVGPRHWRQQGEGPLCPIAVGAALSDFVDLPEGSLSQGLKIADVSRPVLLVPFLSRIAERHGQRIALTFPGGAVGVDGTGAITGDLGCFTGLSAATLTLELLEGAADAESRGPAGCESPVLSRLNDLAMKTTVPPSDRSRADAGAGTSDND